MHDGPFNALSGVSRPCRFARANPYNIFKSLASALGGSVVDLRTRVTVFGKAPGDLPQILHVVAEISASFAHPAMELQVRTLTQRQGALQTF